MQDLELFRKRLLYQSQHRGMSEVDLLLGRFVKQFLPSMNYEQLTELEALLALPDNDLYEWFCKNIP